MHDWSNSQQLLSYAKEQGFALPAVNVTSSSTVVATLEAARDAKSPIVLQVSNGGAAFFAGKGISNTNQEASIAGAIGNYTQSLPACSIIDWHTNFLSSSCRPLHPLRRASLRRSGHPTLRPLC